MRRNNLQEDFNLYIRLGMEVKSRRKALKIKQKDLAKKLNLSNNTLSNIEAGRHACRLFNLQELNRILNLDFKKIFL